jgi:2-keto-4-pentenoate hydratase/2-oxohepta-3-ene-1,7-dioic acid hydratase in catechol pathway
MKTHVPARVTLPTRNAGTEPRERMKLARFNGGRIGIVLGQTIRDVTGMVGIDPAAWPPTGVLKLINDFESYRDQLDTGDGEELPLDAVTLDAPIAWPNKIVAYPVNYRDHGEEMHSDYTAASRGFFLKSPSSISGPTDPIVRPDLPSWEIHHEGELAVIIGKTVRHLSRDEAMGCIFGYSCLLDMTVRGIEVERVMRKSYDTFTPIGPWIVTADELGDPSGLDLKLWVNGVLRQQANTRQLILDIPEMVSMASSVMTLYPGDVIATGTPAGVGAVAAGDTVTLDIERVGRMSIPVVQGQGGSNLALPT